MPSTIGPFDGRRAKRKRCDACAKRQIRCHGGVPCEYCKKLQRHCSLTGASKSSTNVVFVKPKVKENAIVVSSIPRVALPSALRPSRNEAYILFFFAQVLPMQRFAGNAISFPNDILRLTKSSIALHDALGAVAALHAWQSGSYEELGKAGSVDAVQMYSRAVKSVRERVANETLAKDESALWTTFWLGMFELLRDPTGEKFLTHFLHGTTAILQLQLQSYLNVSSSGYPSPGYSSPGSPTNISPTASAALDFLRQIRIFELSRSIIISSPSYLADHKWTNLLSTYLPSTHPKDALFDILPLISSLSIRTLEFCMSSATLSPLVQLEQATSLADEGLELQHRLDIWLRLANTWALDPVHTPWDADIDLTIAYIYHAAARIYLCGTYSYHPQFLLPGSPLTPMLMPSAVTEHVATILSLSRVLLRHGVAGAILLFPLRVAGARAEGDERQEVLSLLEEVQRRGYSVIGTFIADLEGHWKQKDQFK